VERTWRAEEPVLDQAADLFAERLSDDALVERLDELLPRAEPAAADGEAERAATTSPCWPKAHGVALAAVASGP